MLPVIGAANSAAVLATVAVLQAVFAARLGTVADLAAARIARNAQVIELAAVGIQVQSEVAVTGFELTGAAAGGVGAAVAQLTRTVNAVDGGIGDAVVEGVDHAADGIAAIQQRRWAADDFNPLDGDRVQWHRMVIRQRRSIQRADAIAQDTNAITVQAADHRAAGAWAKPG